MRLVNPSRIFMLLFLPALLHASLSRGDEAIAVSGRLDLHGVQTLDNDSVNENDSLTGRLKIDRDSPSWRFHSWLEGGWDGTVRKSGQDHALVRSYDQVYQSNTPYLEFKEFSLARSWNDFDLKAGIQRFAWGRLDEFPPNDLFNPWDYTQFIRKPLEDRKIGVPSLALTLNRDDWTMETVWVPVFVPYRLPRPDERWAGSTFASDLLTVMPNATIVVQEPELPERLLKNGNAGIRIKNAGVIDWAVNLYHGYDTRPVFKTTALVITPPTIDPGYVPDFHRITVLGLDAAAVEGELSLRAEIAYSSNRYLNIRKELWGYPGPLNPVERKHDTLDYGIGADYRLFEDCTLVMQAQQTLIFGNTDLLYEKKRETILWANLKVFWINQKVETNASVAYNPEHGDRMTKADAWYVFTDSWKAGVTGVAFSGPAQSLFGRYSRNDQVEMDMVHSW